jgi:transposase
VETLYIGIDLHGAPFQACALAADGRRLWEQRFARDEGGMATFRERCPPSSAVAIEATTPTWHFVDAIAPGVTRVTVVDPLRTRLKAGYAAKTDRLDARRLADALRRDSVVGIYYPPPAIRELRELCRSRHALVRTRTALIQRIRALLLRHGVREARRRVTSRTGLAWLETVALPSQATAGVGRLRRILAVVLAESAAIDAEVGQVAHADPVVDRLVSIPGIGPVLGLTLRAEIGDISRFATPKHLAGCARSLPVCLDLRRPFIDGYFATGCWSAGTYISRTYCLTMRRVLKRGSTVRIDCLTTWSQRRGIPWSSRS